MVHSDQMSEHVTEGGREKEKEKKANTREMKKLVIK